MRDFAWTVTSNVISRVLFGDRDEMRAARFAANYRGLVGGLSWGLFVPDPLKSERLMGPWRRLVRARHELREMFDAEIAARRAAGLGDCDGDADVCSLLVSAVDEDGNGLTDDEIHDELRSLGAAGIHTTAIVIQWMFDYLLRDPALLARVESDPDDVALGEAIVKETLRLRPPQDSAPRRLVKDVEAGGVRIPAGEVVVPANHLVHRRPELYERPEQFWPDRFLESRVNTFGWLPFGGGAHRCLGASFAELETRIVLREVLKRWRLRPVRKRISRARRSWVFWVPAGGVPVTVTPRTGEPRGTPSDPERALAETGPR
jgi:cytochrome P450